MWHDFNPWSPVDDWFYTLPLQLTAGKSYKLSFYYNTMATTTYSEALEIKLGSLAQSSAMTGTALYSATNLKSSTYQLITVDFTAPTTGVWYLGFHSFSSYSQGGITIDDLSVTENITTAVNNVVNADQLIVQQVFPNPVGNKLNLLVNPAKDFGIMKAVIRDNSGRVVKTVNLQLNGSRTYSVLLQGLQPGLYFVETLHEKTGILSKHKVIKQ